MPGISESGLLFRLFI